MFAPGRSLVLALFLLLGAPSPSTSAPLTLSLRGGFGQAPATVVLTTRIEKHADNRELCALISSGEFETSSCRAHVGTNAPLQVVFQPFRGLPAGEYLALVVVGRQSPTGERSQVTARAPFRILSALGEYP